MSVCDKKCEICTIGTAEKCGLCAPECNKAKLVQRAADGAATAESDVNYRLHATFGAVASNQVKDVMDLIVKVVAFEITAAEKRGEERGRAKSHEENSLMVRQHGICTKEVCDTCKMCDKFYAALREDLKIAKDVEAAKYKAVVEAAKAFTSGGQAELCGACAYGRFNARKLSSALAALEGK